VKRTRLPLLALIGILIVEGGVLLFSKTTLVIEIRNLDRQAGFSGLVRLAGPFSIFYTHSVYNVPVIENLEADTRGILLKGVRTEDPRVMEYYGFEDSKGFHPVQRMLGKSLVLKRGPRADQGVQISGSRVYLSEIAQEGDRLRLELKRISLGLYGWYRLSQPLFGSGPSIALER
jgi:hypothetical protein